MTKAPISLQDLRRRIYVKAKAEPAWRFWGLYVHVCKMETLTEAYLLAKANRGAPGIDGVTFKAVESDGRQAFLEQLQRELANGTYRPDGLHRVEIPKANGKTRTLSIPTIRDRVVQGALKLILEPIFEADFQSCSYGYRPGRSAHDAIDQVRKGLVQRKTRVIDLDLRAYFDNVRHHLLLEKVAKRVNDDALLALLRTILRSAGKKGVPQGGVLSPLLSNICLNEVDRMLEKARKVTTTPWGTRLEYARFADDLVVMLDPHPAQEWLFRAVQKRLREEFSRLQVDVNEEKSQVVEVLQGGSFSFLGFDFKLIQTRAGRKMALTTPKVTKRTELLKKLKGIFSRSRSQPLSGVIEQINPILRGWVNYFAIGHSSQCFNYVRLWVEKKVRRHLARASKRRGFGWKRWSKQWLYGSMKLFDGYRVKRQSWQKASPAR